VTNDITDFVNYHRFQDQIVTAGKWIVKVSNSGSVRIQADGNQITLHNVLYSTDFTERIISVKELTRHGCVATFDENQGVVRLKDEVVLVAKPWFGLWAVRTNAHVLLTVNVTGHFLFRLFY